MRNSRSSLPAIPVASQTEPDHLDSALSIVEALVPLCVRGTAVQVTSAVRRDLSLLPAVPLSSALMQSWREPTGKSKQTDWGSGCRGSERKENKQRFFARRINNIHRKTHQKFKGWVQVKVFLGSCLGTQAKSGENFHRLKCS